MELQGRYHRGLSCRDVVILKSFMYMLLNDNLMYYYNLVSIKSNVIYYENYETKIV